MIETPHMETRRAAPHAPALQAYEHAREAGQHVRHRVDVVDEPTLEYGVPRQRPTLSVFLVDGRRATGEHVEHRFADPATTAFKAGFGFTAGAGLFRLIAAVSGLLILVVVATIVAAMVGF